MDKLAHPLARGASWLLIYLTAVQPLHPAIAAGITAANGNTQVAMKPGNVPVVNIATPNAAGISHNTYQDFNVGTPGAVLNNATQGGKTQLGVTIDNGNARLKGKPAELIINEVTSGNRSELKGRLEVFGSKAGVMIANPNGITCDGCGFINTPSVTLTTGKPQFDKQGALEALEVKKGAVIIGGNGLNGASTEYVDVISRATELNGKINAKTLTLTQGANRVSFKDGTIKPIAGEGAKPQLAVDTKALGGMYAGKIRLVATEAGVGVNLSNIDSQQRDIALSVNGKMTLSGKNHSKTDMNVSAQELRVLSGTTAQADGSMTLATTRLSNSGALTTSGDMRIFSESVRNNDEKSRLHANKSMWIQKDAQGDVSTVVENLGGTIKTNTGDMVIRTRKLNNNAPYTRATRAASIEGGASVYINADILENHQSNLKAVRSLILTGQRLTHWEDTAAPAAQGKIQAGDDVVADFSGNIEILTMTPHRAVHGADAIIGRNILLRGGAVYNHASLSAGKDLTVMAHQAGFYSADVNQGRLRAGGNLSLISNGGVDASQTELYGKNIDIVAREGDVLLTTPAQGRLHRRMPEGQTYTPVDSRNYAADGSRILTILSAGQDISLYGLDVTVHDVLISRARNFSAHARESLSVGQTSAAWQMDAARLKPTGTQTTDDLRRMLVNRQMERLDRLETTGDMTLYGQRGLYLDGQRISAGGNLTLTSGQDIRLDTRNISGLDKTLLPVTRYGELWASAVAGGNLQLSAGRDILLKGTQLSAKNRLTLMAGHDINADSLMWTAVTNPGEWHRDERQRGVLLQGDRGVSLSASGALSVTGGRLESRGDITLTSRGDMRMASARTRFNDGKTERYGHTGTEISSGGNLTLLSAGSILFQASRLLAGGAIDVAAEGGYLYAQAMEEVYRWEETSKKCNSFLGIKSCKVFGSQTKVQTKERSTNKVTEFVAPGNISLLARNNVMLEASRVEAGKNARIISHNGSVIFRAVKNTAYEREVTNGKGFFITQGDRGYYRQNFMLPGIWAGGKLTVEAATGITADIKVKNGQTLQQAIDGLSQEPGGKWIKHINQGNNTQWSVVKDAYDSWDYHSQSLNPAVAAVIAIAASAATAGSGLAIAAANSFGGGVMSAGVMGGMQALAAQAAVALVEHQGNLSKTLKTLGSNGTVRAVVSNMLISGALQGFDEQLKLSQATPGNPVAAKLPTLDYTRWSDVTTRVAGQSLISSGVNTAIYGGSFREKLTTALLSNVAGQIQAEGAGLIGDNGKVLGLPGKVLSHAVVAGISAEIGRGNVRGAAVGALAAELSAITLGDIFIEPATRDTRIQSAGRIIGAITGAAVTNSSGGAISGANAAENVLRYNFLMHDEPSKMARKLAGCKGNSQCETGVRKEMAQLSAQNEKKFESCRVAGNGDCINEMLAGISGASGYRELGLQIGFDIAGQYQQMGENAYDRFDTCGWTAGTGCGLKLWGKEALADAAMWAAGWGVGKVVAPAIGKYLTEVGILSQKGVPAYIRSAQVGLGKPEVVDVYKNQMRNNTFPLVPEKGVIAGYVDKKGVYYLSEGNHRMVAAVEFYNETGNPHYINLLIKNGSWTYNANYMGTSKALPLRK